SALAPRLFLSLILPPPSSSLFPYTTLFRSRLVNPAVLRQRDLLVRAGVDVEDAEDDHELFVLPDRYIEGLVRDRDREDDGILSQDRKSTRLNSSHGSISYAVFCLKKKNNRD